MENTKMMCSLPWYLNKYWVTCEIYAAIGFPAAMLLTIIFFVLGAYIVYHAMYK
jgi:UPF0716 family protein affecting phage T7 exclusion